MILVDSCVLIDVLEGDPVWAEWSADQLSRRRASRAFAINIVIYAEIAKSFASMDDLDAFVREVGLTVAEISRDAAWAAASVHLAYRRNKGSMSLTLPDFFIGAHAQTAGCPILTRDRKRFSTYFPSVELIRPE